MSVKVLKEKDGTPTKIEFGGQVYALVPKEYINGNKNKGKKKRERE